MLGRGPVSQDPGLQARGSPGHWGRLRATATALRPEAREQCQVTVVSPGQAAPSSPSFLKGDGPSGQGEAWGLPPLIRGGGQRPHREVASPTGLAPRRTASRVLLPRLQRLLHGRPGPGHNPIPLGETSTR